MAMRDEPYHPEFDPWSDLNGVGIPKANLQGRDEATFRRCQGWLSKDRPSENDMACVLVSMDSEPQFRQALWSWAGEVADKDEYVMIYVTAPDPIPGRFKEKLLNMAVSIARQLKSWLPQESTNGTDKFGTHIKRFYELLSLDSIGDSKLETWLESLESLPKLDIGNRKLCCVVDRISRFLGPEIPGNDLDITSMVLTLYFVFALNNQGRLLFYDLVESKKWYESSGCQIELIGKV